MRKVLPSSCASIAWELSAEWVCVIKWCSQPDRDLRCCPLTAELFLWWSPARAAEPSPFLVPWPATGAEVGRPPLATRAPSLDRKSHLSLSPSSRYRDGACNTGRCLRAPRVCFRAISCCPYWLVLPVKAVPIANPWSRPVFSRGFLRRRILFRTRQNNFTEWKHLEKASLAKPPVIHALRLCATQGNFSSLICLVAMCGGEMRLTECERIDSPATLSQCSHRHSSSIDRFCKWREGHCARIIYLLTDQCSYVWDCCDSPLRAVAAAVPPMSPSFPLNCLRLRRIDASLFWFGP